MSIDGLNFYMDTNDNSISELQNQTGTSPRGKDEGTKGDMNDQSKHFHTCQVGVPLSTMEIMVEK